MNKFLNILFCFVLLNVSAQNFELEQIMKGNDFIGHLPENPRWAIDGSTFYFNWNPKNDVGNSVYSWNFKTQKEEIAVSKKEELLSRDFETQNFFETIYYTNDGNLYSYNKKSKSKKLIIKNSERINNVQRSSVENIIFFQQNRNVFQLDLKDYTLIQLTNFQTTTNQISEKESEPEKYLQEQQEELFQYIKDNKKEREWYAEQNKTEKKAPNKFSFGKSTLEQIKVSPKGKFVTFRLSDYAKEHPTKVEHFITETGYTQNKSARAKVSINGISKHKMGIYEVEKDSVYYISFSDLSGIKEFPAYYQEYEKLKSEEAEEKAIVMQSPIYNQDGSYAVFEIRSQDNKDRWIVQLDLASGKIIELDHQHDEAWIGGPGIPSYSFGGGTLGFIDNKTIYFQSEASGYSHLYTLNLSNKKKTQLTKGNWEVREAKLSLDEKAFYISANKLHPGNREFYKLEIATQKLIPILTKDGAHEVEISPDEKQLLVRYSYKNKPWELYLAENKPNAQLKQITFSTTKEFETYVWKEPKVITFKAKDEKEVYARLYEPKTEIKNKAAIIFVHGAGYLQNAHNYWSSYQREYMFHNLLTDLGYTVLDIDYRGSDGYGRDVRTGIYRHMGGLDLEDHLDGKNYLVNQLGIDKEKVGIYGGSYGGFITLMALLTKPSEFKAGAALRSVTDWAHYNHGYTSNILNFPETDELAYRKSSPIYFAENLQDKLLMLHGMIDDNVQFQDVVRLSQRFIELGKKDWDLAVYPIESHGFTETYSWIDEYRRILDLFNQNLLKP